MLNRVRQYVTIPCTDTDVDITDIATIYDHPSFQALAGRAQLGPIVKVYPGARHSRLEHSLGAFHNAKLFLYRLLREGVITEAEKLAIQVYALLHDVGHGPGSHAIESVCRITHKDNGIRIALEMKEVIEALGVPIANLVRLMQKKNPLAQIISDHNLGAEKMDYLRRDAHHCGLKEPNTSILSRNLVYEDGILGINASVIEEAKRLLLDYAIMYRNVYLKLRCLRFSRMFAKMVAALLEKELTEAELWDMTDAELEGRFSLSKHLTINYLYPKYRNAEKPHTVVVVRPDGTQRFELERDQKFVTVVDPALFFTGASTYHEAMLCEIEQRVGDELCIPNWAVIAIPPLEKHRFEPKDIVIFHQNTRLSLQDRDPHAFADIRATYEQYAGLRICVFARNREAAWQKHEELARIVVDVLQKYATNA